jgi:hypothetical protein
MKINQLFKQSHIEVWRGGSSAGNGSLPEVGVPAICEQSVNKGADKKAEGVTPLQ